MGLITTTNGLVFVDNSRGPVTSSGNPNSINPDKVIGIIEADQVSKSILFSVPSSSLSPNLKVNTLYVTQSGGNAQLGIGTTSPIGSLDIRSPKLNVPPNLTLRTNNDDTVTVGEETGKLRFLIESSSFNLGKLDLAISGSTAEIFSRVTEIDTSGVKGSLVFGISAANTTENIDAFSLGYNIGPATLGDTTVHAILSGSAYFTTGIPKLILNRDGQSGNVVELGSLQAGFTRYGVLKLKDDITNDFRVVLTTDPTADSYISGAGNFGIGTSSPSVPFHVVGNSLLEGVVDITGDLDMNNNNISNPSGIDQTTTDLTITLGTNDLNIDGNAINFNNSSIILDTGGHITASGNISASGDLMASGAFFTGLQGPETQSYALYWGDYTDGRITYGDFQTSAITALNNGTENNLVTVGANTTELDSEPNLTFDGSNLTVIGSITASGDISASGILFASTSNASGASYNTLIVDTSTGRFYHTGSYGGGSSLTVGGVAGAIQYSNGSGVLDFDNTFKWSDVGVLNVGNIFKINVQDDADDNKNRPVNIATGPKNTFQLSKVVQKAIYASFDPLLGYFMLHPIHDLNNESSANDVNSVITNEFIASSRFHVIDQYSKAHIAKIINLGNTGINGKENLLLGTAHTSNTLSSIQDIPYHKFVDFQTECGVHGGTSIAGIYYDPTDYLGGGGSQALYTVKYQGILVSPSDKKLKKDITDTNRSIDDIMSMKVKDYRWKDTLEETKKSTGLIAQELQETHPELVSNLDNTLNVNYTDIIPMLIKAVQDQQKEITNLKNQIKNIEK